jgi:hypothetical protein
MVAILVNAGDTSHPDRRSTSTRTAPAQNPIE